METGCRISRGMELLMGAMLGEKPVLIVFDLDGTLTDSAELGRVLFKRIFEMLGYGVISDELADSFNGPSADEVCRVMGVEGEQRRLYDHLMDTIEVELVKESGVVYPGVIAMLEMLKGHAVMAILTNGTQAYCEACIAEYGFTPYIDLHSGYVSGVSKSQRMLQWQQEVDARRVVVVGDRGTDVKYAREAGAYAIGVTYGMGSREELSGADALCDTAIDVAKECLRVICQG
ncbi:MAG: HAD family hydrolase [Clostridia bacterium]|nr:HAD family hydrolase [Clostridia bacterium]